VAQNDEIVIRVVQLDVQDAAAVAGLHRSAISTGFLSALGERFTERMYRAILSCPHAFGFGVKDQAGRMLGFMVCAEDIGKTYRYSILRHGLSMGLPLLRQACRFAVVRRLWETFRYPSVVDTTLPRSEVLSIAVSRLLRSRGVGQMLLHTAFEELRNRGVERVKVAVAAANTGANRFYARCGFRLALTRLHHGEPMNIYDIDLTDGSPCNQWPAGPERKAQRSVRPAGLPAA
jgi:ribosomal protein S18 acetylase RimI-like enzyme